MLRICNSFWYTQEWSFSNILCWRPRLFVCFVALISSLSFSIPTEHAGDYQLLQFLPTYMLSIFWLMSVGVKWYFITIFVSLSLMYLLVIHMLPCIKWLFKSFAQLKNCFFIVDLSKFLHKHIKHMCYTIFPSLWVIYLLS